MHYRKGDIIKLWRGVIGIVLDDGMSGFDFYNEHGYKEFLEIFYDLSSYSGYYFNYEQLKVFVWYNILVGDKKGWLAIYAGQKKRTPLDHARDKRI